MLAVGDLEHYHALMVDALRAQTFTVQEATILVDVCRGWLVTSPDDAACLWQEVEMYFAIGTSMSAYMGPTTASASDFVVRLKRLTPMEAHAVVRAAKRAFAMGSDLPTSLAVSGLVNSVDPQSATSLEAPITQSAAA